MIHLLILALSEQCRGAVDLVTMTMTMTGTVTVTEVEAEEFVQFIRDPSDVLVLFL